MKRVLVYSHDTFGLGNIRRMLEVARHLVAASPAVSVLVVTGSPMLHAMRLPPRVDTVKLPCLSRTVDGLYGARHLDLSLAQTLKLRANLLRSTVADFAPDLILVDKKPFGVEDELAGALAELPTGASRPRLVLLLRDILDSPAATRHVWRKNGCFEAIEAYYDQVLVLGSPAVFDMRLEYAFPPFAAAKLLFCGYVAREPGQRDRASVRREWGVAPGQPLVLVTPGGGEDGHALVKAYLDGLEALPAERRPRSHIVYGPEMAEPARAALQRQAHTLPSVSDQVFCDDMMSLMAAADVAVCMGGYNTVCELLTLRRRAVVVPRTRPGLEQCIRAERLSALGLLRMLHPEALQPGQLLQAVAEELAHAADTAAPPARTAAALDMHGLARCSAQLLGHLGLHADAQALGRPAAGREGARPVDHHHSRGPAWNRHAQPTHAPSAC